MLIVPAVKIDDAARQTGDVIVLGSGPAGIVTSPLLVREGANVLFIDRRSFLPVKVCGSCLNGHALAVLEHAGLAEVVDSRAGCRLHAFYLTTGNHRTQLGLPAGLPYPAWCSTLCLCVRRSRPARRFCLQPPAGLGPSLTNTALSIPIIREIAGHLLPVLSYRRPG